MLRLIIADDEEDIRLGIYKSIDWEANGITVVGLFGDGLSLTDGIIDLDPDVILLDIQMPGKSGLEVIRSLNEQGILPYYIILSGYDRFDYAKEALKLGVEDYLLKPCSETQILSAIKNTYEKKKKVDALLLGELSSPGIRLFPGQRFDVYEKASQDSAISYPVQLEKQVLNGIRNADHCLQTYVRSFVETVWLKNVSIINRLYCCSLLHTEINRLLMEEGNFENISKDMQLQTPDKDAVTQKLTDFSLYVSEVLLHARAKNHLVETIKQYIQQNYAGIINLNVLSETIGISPAYISRLFKSKTGIGLIEYLNETRVNAAKDLLIEGKKVYEVSRLVGYENEKYFSLIFKKTTGMTTTQFRSMHS